jgi:uncharacterized membrane protein (UPF0127 family)
MKLLLLLAAFAAAGVPLKASKHAPLTFPDGKTINADVVDTPMDRERGLMFYKKLPRDYGMLFVFSRELPMHFWMKNTLVPLDMVFIGADKTITVVHERVPASTESTPDSKVARAGGMAQYVLELPAGAAARHKLKAGQALKFDAAIPNR